MQRKTTVVVGVQSVLIVILATTAVASDAGASAVGPAACPAVFSLDGEESVAASTIVDGVTQVDSCDLEGVLVVGEGYVIEVPGPGEFLQLEAFGVADEEPTVTGVSVMPDGTLIMNFDLDPDPRPEPEPSGGACSDGAYNLIDGTDRGPFRVDPTVSADRDTIPNRLDAPDTMAWIEDALRAWPKQFTDCAMNDQVDRAMDWGGDTDSATSIGWELRDDGTSALGCYEGNAVSTVSFTRFTPGALGATCRHGMTDSDGKHFVNGADIAIPDQEAVFTDGGWWFGNIPWTLRGGAAACDSQYDLPSVLTHEAGHFWGMGHVARNAHPLLTMRNGGVGAVMCNTMLRTLGKGDILGMRDLYPN